MGVCLHSCQCVQTGQWLLTEHLPHICSSLHDRTVPGTQHYNCQYRLLLEWLAGCRHCILEHIFFTNVLEERTKLVEAWQLSLCCTFQTQREFMLLYENETLLRSDIQMNCKKKNQLKYFLCSSFLLTIISDSYL